MTEKVDAVFALDIGVYNTGASGQILASTTAAWCRLTSGLTDFSPLHHQGTPTVGSFRLGSAPDAPTYCACGRSIEKLADLIAMDIRGGGRVALGFEAPMWMPIERQHRSRLSLFAPRFAAEEGSEWYLQSGAAATLKALSLGVMLRDHLRAHLSTLPRTTRIESWQSGAIILFEAFVAGPYKVDGGSSAAKAPNEWDALVAALAWGNLHAGFSVPPSVVATSVHPGGSRKDPCLSVWDFVFADVAFPHSGPPDCEVVALQSRRSTAASAATSESSQRDLLSAAEQGAAPGGARPAGEPQGARRS